MDIALKWRGDNSSVEEAHRNFRGQASFAAAGFYTMENK